MAEEQFAVIFRGDIAMGNNLLEVKQKLKKLFKVDDARIDHLFAGNPVPLKRNLVIEEAKRYQLVLQQAGAVVSIESMSALSVVTKAPSKKPVEQSDAIGESTESPPAQGEWQLAPVGSVLSEKQQQSHKVADIATDHLKVLPQQGNLLNDDERQPVPSATVDLETLDWELTPYGEALLKEAEKIIVKPQEIDTSSLSVAEMEGNLLKDSERPSVEPVDVDTSRLDLVPDENDKP